MWTERVWVHVWGGVMGSHRTWLAAHLHLLKKVGMEIGMGWKSLWCGCSNQARGKEHSAATRTATPALGLARGEAASVPRQRR